MVVKPTYGAVQADPDVAVFTGLACSWEVNNNNIRVRPGAFRKAIQGAEAERKANNGRMLWPVLWEHKPEQAFGGITFAEEREDGLYVEGFLDPLTPECQKALQKAKSGAVNGLSIGFETLVEHQEGTVRVIDQLELYEISVGAYPIDDLARLRVKKFSELEYAMMRAVNQEKGSEVGSVVYIDDEDGYERPLLGSIDAAETAEPSYHIEYGRPEESRQEFERELRRELRESDPDLYGLTPAGKAFKKEVERRIKERQDKQRQQHAALLKERQEQAERQAAMSAETFTPESFAKATGLDTAWVRNWFIHWLNGGRITAVDVEALVLRGQDVRYMGRHDHEMLEGQFEKAAMKRLQGKAA